MALKDDFMAFITDAGTGKVKRGAYSRVAEHLRVTIETVKRWLRGEGNPSRARIAEIRDMIAKNVDLSPKSCAPHNRRKTADFYAWRNGHRK